MSRLVDIVPGGDTAPAFERAAIEVVDARSLLTGRPRRIVGARHDEVIDPALLPWLLRDWGLDEAAGFVDDWQLLYREGKAWLRQLGTLGAVDQSLAWIGEAGAEIEEIMPGSPRWAELQVALQAAPETLEQARRVIGLTRLSIGAKSVLNRVHAGFDKRAARPDFARLDDCLLDFDSGVVLRPDWPILSFGRRIDAAVDMASLREVGTVESVRNRLGAARYVDDVMLDQSLLFWQYPSVYRPFQFGRLDSFEMTSGARRDQFFETGEIYKAGIILDKQWPVESLNAVFPGCRFVREGHAWLADGFSPAHHTDWRRRVPVKEIRRNYVSGIAPIPPLTTTGLARVRAGGVEIKAATLDAGETLLGSIATGGAAYDGQSWVDLVVPEDATWNDLHVLIGTSLNGDPDE